ncbi:MAG: NTP transferase domain-containing protein [Pseudomonadales bacterium]
MTEGSQSACVAVAILAGERPGGSVLARHFAMPSSVLVPLAGRTPLEFALQALEASAWIDGGWLLGPNPEALEACPGAHAAVRRAGLKPWPVSSGPAASLLTLLEAQPNRPLLVTTADHALLTKDIVDHFIAAARHSNADVVAGLVPYERVAAAHPESRRTLLKLRDGPFCGANLFWLNNRNADHAVAAWRRFEAHRKAPWKMVRMLGLGTLGRYLTGQLDSHQAAARLSRLCSARVAFVSLPFANAAVDVDSIADWSLAEQLLSQQRH